MKQRQGDLIISKITSLPKGVRRLRHNTLALGEFTGHHHTVYPIGGAKVSTYEDVKELVKYIQIEGKAVLKHQEHKEEVLEPGIYEVKIKRNYDYFSETIQQVRD